MTTLWVQSVGKTVGSTLFVSKIKCYATYFFKNSYKGTLGVMCSKTRNAAIYTYQIEIIWLFVLLTVESKKYSTNPLPSLMQLNVFFYVKPVVTVSYRGNMSYP
jgi:hypothetical protein